MSELKSLKKQQSSIVTRVKTTLAKALDAQSEPSSSTKIRAFKIRLLDLECQCTQFDKYHFDIVKLELTEDQEREQSAIVEAFDDVKYSIRSIARDLFPESNPQGPATPVLIPDPNRGLEIQKVSLPTFNGTDLRAWPTFLDLFNSLVHDKVELSEIAKFQALSTALVGEAQSVIRNIPLVASNYRLAYDAVVRLYNNKRRLVTHYWSSIYSAPSAKSNNSRELRKLLSTFRENIEALTNFNDLDLLDFIKMNLLLQKIDPTLKQKFEVESSTKEIPTYKNLFTFLEQNCRALENCSLLDNLLNTGSASPSSGQGGGRRTSKPPYSLTTRVNSCSCCMQKGFHPLIKCDKFLEMEVSQRHALIKREHLCFNCFGNHPVSQCPNTVSCRVCSGRHHTLLCFRKKLSQNDSASTTSPTPRSTMCTSTIVNHSSEPVEVKSVLFATAQVLILNNHRALIPCRALFDTASEASFISLSCATKLKLPIVPNSTPVHGLNSMSCNVSHGTMNLEICSKNFPDSLFRCEAIITPKICGPTPSTSVKSSLSQWPYLEGLEIADPNFGKPSDVDILIGVDLFSQMLVPGFIKGQDGPSAMNTIFGWVLFGGFHKSTPSKFVNLLTTIDYPNSCALSDSMRKFWEIECVPQEVPLSVEEKKCEDIFQSTISRDPSGKYIVRLPFRDSSPDLGDSRNQALRRFNLLENRLAKNPTLRQLYNDFMQDYVDQGHMTPSLSFENPSYYLPHHCVLKDEHGTPRIRVVFDGGASSSNGLSLNDVLLTGPKLQNDIAKILLSFRFYPFVFSTDIRQMFRNIIVNDKDVRYQKILWRFDTSEPIRDWNLRTVTYGLNCSPYLAIRTLHQLVADHGDNYPLASSIILNSSFVDDLVGKSLSMEQGLELQEQLIGLLSCGGFELRKWTSNCPELLATIPESHQQNISFLEKDNTVLKILGLQWNPAIDAFLYSVKPINRDCTKRVILSEIARIYDPLGFLAPVVLVAKVLIQRLWLEGLSWDETPPIDVVNQWQQYVTQLPLLSTIAIPRYVVKHTAVTTEIHGFCDASSVAYGGVIYVRQIHLDGKISVALLCAKSRVCPLKTISIPRLELCAALLLAELMEFVTTNFEVVPLDRIFAWSDSQVALAWIKSSPSKRKVFVANRVTTIQEKIPPDRWYHISGVENPADCLSRSLLPSQFVDHHLWFTGPPWLSSTVDFWPISNNLEVEEMDVPTEENRLVLVTITAAPNVLLTLLERFSSLRKIQGIVAYCLRPYRLKKDPAFSSNSLALCHEELYFSLCIMVRIVQQEVFSDDLKRLQKGEPCSKPLRKLAPFLDSQGVLRVGGRLRHTDLAYEVKHPMLLPRDHRLTLLVIEKFHIDHGHPGPRLLEYLLAQQFWILSVKRATHKVIADCFTCVRINPKPYSPYMGDLPKARVSQLKPFSHVSVDFMGPFQITLAKRRGAKSQKAYGCIFVCFSTKAIHLEAVSDLTAEAFLAAIRRFVGRRGRCSALYSDQGTNMIGADNLLTGYCRQAAESLSIKWHFNPPAGPHFGGLHESGVKSTKTHLRRIVGNQIMTFEELVTVLVQIEATLNSRPLCSISPDPNDLQSLTPGHFLTLEPLTSPPDETLLDCRQNRLTRWQLVQQMHQHFWRRWHVEYLHSLQQREKWNTPDNPPKVGVLVALKDENLPPLRWSLGRITKIYPSPDSIPRIVQVKTAKGFLDRPLVKVCPLPTH